MTVRHSICIPGNRAPERVALFDIMEQLALSNMRDILCNTSLHLESSSKVSLIGFRPNVKIIFGADKLRGDVKAVANTLDAAFQNICDIERLGND